MSIADADYRLTEKPTKINVFRMECGKILSVNGHYFDGSWIYFEIKRTVTDYGPGWYANIPGIRVREEDFDFDAVSNVLREYGINLPPRNELEDRGVFWKDALII